MNREKIVKQLEEIMNLDDNTRNKLFDIVNKYPLRKIIVAYKILYSKALDKNMRVKNKVTIEEFEKVLRRVRF